MFKSLLKRTGLHGPVRYAYRLLKHRFRYYRHSKHRVLETELIPEQEFKSFLHDAIRRLSKSPSGDYLEFGVFNGRSLASTYEALNELNLNHMRLFGFDSFDGLPLNADEEDAGIWRPGQFKCDIHLTRKSLSERGIDWKRVFLIKGWFEDTLTNETRQQYGIEKASIIMVDCDMYSSAVKALKFCQPPIQDEAIIIFDDWFAAGLDTKNLGEKRAFTEFLDAYPDFEAAEIGSYNDNSLGFHIRRRQAA